MSTKKRIVTDSATTTVINFSVMLFQIVIAVGAAGTTWKLTIQDRASPSPFILVPQTTLSAPTTPTAIVISFPEPIRMDGGIDVVTAGTHGELAVWFNFDDGN